MKAKELQKKYLEAFGVELHKDRFSGVICRHGKNSARLLGLDAKRLRSVGAIAGELGVNVSQISALVRSLKIPRREILILKQYARGQGFVMAKGVRGGIDAKGQAAIKQHFAVNEQSVKAFCNMHLNRYGYTVSAANAALFMTENPDYLELCGFGTEKAYSFDDVAVMLDTTYATVRRHKKKLGIKTMFIYRVMARRKRLDSGEGDKNVLLKKTSGYSVEAVKESDIEKIRESYLASIEEMRKKGIYNAGRQSAPVSNQKKWLYPDVWGLPYAKLCPFFAAVDRLKAQQ